MFEIIYYLMATKQNFQLRAVCMLKNKIEMKAELVINCMFA